MVDERAEMIRELQQLRRGHGLHSTDVMSRIGPLLAKAAGIDSGTPASEQRQLLVERISIAIRDLPDDLRLSVQAAFGLDPASTSRFLRERMEWLGNELHRDPRTAVRRVESGLALLAELLLSPARPGPHERGSSYAPDGWYVNRLRSTLLMHLDPDQLLETRQLTSTRDGLQEITVSWSVPIDGPGAPQLQVDMLYGGELHKNKHESTARYWSGVIRLPRPLEAGEQHEYQVRVLSLRSHLRPFYVLTPFQRFDEFVLRAKFNAGGIPGQVWLLDGVPFQRLEDERPVGTPLAADAVGEVQGRFFNLRRGMSYGLRWVDASVALRPSSGRRQSRPSGQST